MTAGTIIIVMSVIAIIVVVLLIVINMQARSKCDEPNNGFLGHWAWGQTDAWWSTQPLQAQIDYYRKETARKQDITEERVTDCWNNKKSSKFKNHLQTQTGTLAPDKI